MASLKSKLIALVKDVGALHATQGITCWQRNAHWIVKRYGLCQFCQEDCFAIASLFYSVLLREKNTLLYHSEVWWLSHRTVLAHTSIQFLLLQNHVELTANVSGDVWVNKITYCVDVFSELNRLNSSMQGPNTHANHLYDRLEGFLKKILRWRERVREFFHVSIGGWVGRFCSALTSCNAQLLQTWRQLRANLGNTFLRLTPV